MAISPFTRATFALALAAAACAPNRPGRVATAAEPDAMPGHDMASMPGHDMANMANLPGMAALPATAGPGYTVADVRFMQHMMGHHAQAIIMAGKAPDHGASTNVQRLAQKIAISQRDEIAFMKRWLSERQQAIPSDSLSLAMVMPGMLTPAQMATLDASSGSGFDRYFLTFMIGHHRGALTMVADLFKATGAGQDPEIFRFATDVDADQRDEIYVMQQMLDMIR